MNDRFKRNKQIKGFLYFITIFPLVALVSIWLAANLVIPSEIVLFQGHNANIELPLPIFELEKQNGEYTAVGASSVKARKQGEESVTVSLFGVIPVKHVKVKVLPQTNCLVSGKLIGLKIKSSQLLVVGVDKVQTAEGDISPGQEADVKKGDYIVQADGQVVDEVSQLSQIIAEKENDSITLLIRRDDKYVSKTLKLGKSLEDGSKRIGLWMRDGISGLGTMTFADNSASKYGSLGHAVTDVDTGSVMLVDEGRIYDASMISSKKGAVGTPGEIKGVINDDSELGNIRINCEQGIYGALNTSDIGQLGGKSFPVADRFEIQEGKATIFSEAADNKIQEYEVQINRINRGSVFGSKGFEVTVSDSKLLNKTGGIVQGMSGSPVVQNGKFIGAVTHVMVNNPQRGYGIFADGMLEITDSLE